jgi:hypothetical protein
LINNSSNYFSVSANSQSNVDSGETETNELMSLDGAFWLKPQSSQLTESTHADVHIKGRAEHRESFSVTKARVADEQTKFFTSRVGVE